jgi:FkbM family methyltransferase
LTAGVPVGKAEILRRPKALSHDTSQFEHDLELLLAEGVDGARKREESAFEEIAGDKVKQFVLFGAGNLGRRTLDCLRQTGIEPLCFVDNDSSKWGSKIDGLEVLSPAKGSDLYKNHATFVVTIWRGEGSERMRDRAAQLLHLGCSRVVPFLPFYWRFSKSLLPHYALDLPHRVHLEADRVREGLALMSDDESRREYIAELRFRLLGDFDCLPDPVSGAIYFRDELFRLKNNEVLIDCGAFDGDTIADFLERTDKQFESIVAFEPDPGNFSKLKGRVASFPREMGNKIILHQSATGDVDKRVKMAIGAGPSSHLGSGDHEVECYALDSILGGCLVSILKMDIEGSELATLQGAQKLIKENAPVLAICAYHRQDDLWTIPLAIRKLNPDYSIYFRPHLLEGWDLVCYAVPPNRQISNG